MKNRYSIIILLGITFFFSSCNAKQTKNQDSMEHVKHKPGGIIFFATEHLDEISEFYISKVGCELWLDQGACKIVKHGNMLFGFCQSDHVDKDAVITFFYPNKQHVDQMYEQLKGRAVEPPKMNPEFHIYHFYARDPENRSIEFQYFDHELKDY